MPLDYNAWLVFRGLVDFVLLNDFSSYIIFAFAFMERPAALTWLDGVRYLVGLGLCVFNWFIKIDALRVVKDYAWCTCTLGRSRTAAIWTALCAGPAPRTALRAGLRAGPVLRTALGAALRAGLRAGSALRTAVRGSGLTMPSRPCPHSALPPSLRRGPDWGDFFFLVDGTLTFDGVFQMAPHPKIGRAHV